jgi:hypothetical protein
MAVSAVINTALEVIDGTKSSFKPLLINPHMIEQKVEAEHLKQDIA